MFSYRFDVIFTRFGDSHRGPGKPLLRGPITSSCAKNETPKASRGRKSREGCPRTVRLWVWGRVVSSPSGVRGRAPVENVFYAYLKSE